MFKTGELLKRKIRRYVVPTVAMVVLAAITLVVCAAVSGKVVYIYDGDVVTNLKTAKFTVGEALEEAEIIPGEFDVVDPSADTAIENGMEIHITRAIPISLTDGGQTREVYTLSQTVADVLKEQGITYAGFDTVSPAPEMPVARGMCIDVRRSKTIMYTGDGETLPVSTLMNTVGEMMVALGVSMDENDFTEPSMDTALYEGLEVRLVRVEAITVTEEETVGYTIEEKNTSALTKGKTRVAQNGKNGVRTNTYSVVMHNGEEVSRELVSSEITREPVKKIVEKGTAAPKAAPKKTGSSSSTSSAASYGGGTASTAKGENFTYKKLIVCTATAYDLSYESCGKNPGDPYYGITASGMKAGPGVIAVDPSVIPLGTRLYVEAADGSWTYGYCVAGDTGSGIYGNRVDLFFNTRQEVRNFGRRTANVYVL